MGQPRSRSRSPRWPTTRCSSVGSTPGSRPCGSRSSAHSLNPTDTTTHRKEQTMVRRTRVAALCGAALLATALVAGCTPGTAPAPLTSPTAEPEGTIEFWHFFTDREATAIAGVVHDFEASHPKIHVVIKDGQDDAKM